MPVHHLPILDMRVPNPVITEILSAGRRHDRQSVTKQFDRTKEGLLVCLRATGLSNGQYGSRERPGALIQHQASSWDSHAKDASDSTSHRVCGSCGGFAGVTALGWGNVGFGFSNLSSDMGG